MNILAVDAMGGDHAPKSIIEGVNQAIKDFPDIRIQLYGSEPEISQHLIVSDRVSIIHTKETIASEDEPVKAIRQKKEASMVLAARAVKEKEADAMISAGNTGALLAAGLFIIGRLPAIERPGLLSTLPTKDGSGVDMLDLGANAENTANHLYQYAILGNLYAKTVRGIANPRIGLLNNGTEKTKGNRVTKEVYQLLSDDNDLHFIGNVEARDLLDGVCDVLVTDGFTGNAVLKAVEGTAKTLMTQLKQSMTQTSFKAKLGALLLKDSLKTVKDNLDYRQAGGAVFIGLKAPLVKAHGSSDAAAIYHTIKQVRQMLITATLDELTRYLQVEKD